MKTSAVITSTSQAGTKIQKTLTDVNAACTNEVLKTAGQMLNNLTTNTYERTDRVDKQHCDTEAGTSTGKPVPLISIFTDNDDVGCVYLNYNDECIPLEDKYVNFDSDQLPAEFAFFVPKDYYFTTGEGTPIVKHLLSGAAAGGVPVTIMTAENENYAAGYATCLSGGSGS